MRFAPHSLDAEVPHLVNADAFGDHDLDDSIAGFGEGVVGVLPVGDDTDSADGRVEAEVTDKFGQTREIRFRGNHDVHATGHHLNPEC